MQFLIIILYHPCVTIFLATTLTWEKIAGCVYLIIWLYIWLNSFLNVLCSLLKFDMLDTLFLINIWFISSLPWNGLSIIMNNTTNKKLFMYRLNKSKLTRKIEFYLKSLQKAEKYLEPKRASAMELLCEYT